VSSEGFAGGGGEEEDGEEVGDRRERFLVGGMVVAVAARFIWAGAKQCSSKRWPLRVVRPPSRAISKNQKQIIILFYFILF
jgi:hypothetical protein